ncbi:hypothetical protein HOY82DRAFT_616549 [Tuber indicum]|nr:hypothetical protein HOY82DRAFT_616549 [Tuber indicum]
MRFNPLSAALLYGLLSTTVVVAQTESPPTVTSLGSDGPDPIQKETGKVGPSDNVKGNEGESSAGATIGVVASGSSRPSPSQSSSPKNTSNTGAIAGGVVGGVLFLLLVGALLLFLRKRRRTRDQFGSEEKSADETAANYDGPSLPPVPPVAASESPHPHHSPAAPNEAHALMSHYGDTQPQQMPQEVQPVIMPAKPYDVNSSSREIRGGDEDDDGVSINSPSPVTTPSPERQQEQQRSVPRLPIYQGGRRDDVGGDTPPPAL